MSDCLFIWWRWWYYCARCNKCTKLWFNVFCYNPCLFLAPLSWPNIFSKLENWFSFHKWLNDTFSTKTIQHQLVQWKDSEGNNSGLIKVLSRQLPGGMRKLRRISLKVASVPARFYFHVYVAWGSIVIRKKINLDILMDLNIFRPLYMKKCFFFSKCWLYVGLCVSWQCLKGWTDFIHIW